MTIQKVKLQMVKEPSAIYTAEKITTPFDIVELINSHEQYDLSPTEKVIIIGLNTKNEVNIYMEIATGTPNYANFKISELFKPLLLSNSGRFILVHNHPTGDATPSQEDINITEKVENVARIMGVELLDHIIIADDDYTSIMSERRKIQC